jgi:uncharacterized protein (TIGR04255 family)
VIRSGAPLKLARTPLVYVIGQVKVSAVMAIETFVPAIQEKLRHLGYPRFTRGKLQEIRLAPEGPAFGSADRFEFQDRQGQAGIVLAPDFISFHTSTYDTFEVFQSAMRTALDIVHSVVDCKLVERVGLRYVDFIRVAKDEHIREYVKPGLLGLDPADIGATDALWRFEFVGATEQGKLAVRFSRAQPPLAPPDLFPITLKHDMTLAEGESAFFLDFDHFAEDTEDFSTSGLLEKFGNLHYNLDMAFKAAVTDTALTRWEAKTL